MILRFYLGPAFLAGLALLASGEQSFQSAPCPPIFADEFLPLPPADAAQFTPLAQASAETILDRAAKVLADIRWLEMTVCQHLDTEEGSLNIQGKLVQGPGRRLHLELALQGGQGISKLCWKCDGQHYWQALQHGQEKPEICNGTLLPNGTLPTMAQKQQQLLACRDWIGPLTMVQNLRKRWQDLHQEVGMWRGRPVIRISGHCLAETDHASEDLPDGAAPQHCFLYLDADTLWPCRLEWHHKQRAAELLPPWLYLEFRHPVVNRPLAPDVCAQVFQCPQNNK